MGRKKGILIKCCCSFHFWMHLREIFTSNWNKRTHELVTFAGVYEYHFCVRLMSYTFYHVTFVQNYAYRGVLKSAGAPLRWSLLRWPLNSCWMLQNTKFTLALLGLRTHDIRYAICATSSIASLSIHRALRYQIIQADFSHNNSINNSLGDA